MTNAMGWVMLGVLMTTTMMSTKAQVPGVGPCPEVQSLKTFETEKYVGTWYEIYRFPIIFEGQSRCVKANYSIKADGHIKVLNSDVTTDGKQDSMEGDAFVPDPSQPAQLEVKFNNFIPYSSYWVVDTDYTGHSLVFSCSKLASVAHVTYAWILARQPSLDTTVVNTLKDKLQSFGVDPSSFQQTDQTSCPSFYRG